MSIPNAVNALYKGAKILDELNKTRPKPPVFKMPEIPKPVVGRPAKIILRIK